MKSHWFRYFRFGRPRRSIRVRGTSVVFKRFSSFEGLELRAMLTGSSLLADSALVAAPLATDPYESPIDQLSLASMLSSTQDNSNAPAATPLATNATDDTGSNSNPTVDPLVDSAVIDSSIVIEDLNGNAITEINAGQDFVVKVYVTDARTGQSNPGVSAAFAGLTYNTNLVSLDNPSSLTVDSVFSFLPTKDTSTAGKIVAGGVFIPSGPTDPNLPTEGETQLLWSVTLHAVTSGQATFGLTYENANGDGWFVFGDDNSIPDTSVTLGSASLAINALPTVSIGDVTQAEGNSGDTNFVFTVSLSQASDQAITVVYNTTDGTATSTGTGADYTPTSGTINFEPGTTTKLITVAVIGDTTVEPDETFNVVLSNPTNATLGNDTGLGTILDDDSLPQLSVQDVSQPEGNTVNSMVFTVTLTKAATGTVTVGYSTVDGTATIANNDYNANSGTLTFEAGTTTQLVTVTINGDTVNEPNETFQLVLSDPSGASLLDGTATGTILNDDGPILSFSPATISQAEGNSQTFMIFTVTLNQSSDQDVTVAYNTADGTATIANNDYNAASGTLTFTAGSTTPQLITVAINGDTSVEPDETFSVVLSSPENASISVDTAVATILNDDVPSVTLDGPSSVLESSGSYVVTVQLSAAGTQVANVAWSTADGTAIAGTDYTAASGTLTFIPGQTTQLITIELLSDSVTQPDRTFAINLTDPTNATIAQPSFTATIADTLPTVGVTAPASKNEGNSGPTQFVFTVNLSGESSTPVTVAYNTSDGIATAGSDYNAASGTLTFSANETSKTVTVNVIGDTIYEGDETFRLVLSSPGGATLDSNTSSATAVILNDDAVPTVSISNLSHLEGDTGLTPFVFTVTLSNAASQSVSVQYATQDGTAKAASDYNATSGTLTFAAGETSKTVTVQVIGDLLKEGNETFSVVLSNPSIVTLGNATGVGTIQDESSDSTVIPDSTIMGKVFVDSNGDGTQSGLEKSLAGIEVNLTGAATRSTTTAADGSYGFGKLIPGTYTVTFVLPSQYKSGSAVLGNAGGSKTTNGFTLTIDAAGGVTGSGYHFTTSGLLPQFISQRVLLSSYLGNLSAGTSQVGVSIDTVTDPINASNAASTSISGFGTVGANVSVVASDGTNSTAAQTTTISAGGTWSISGINVLALADGTITYTVTASGSGTTDTSTISATKDTVAPTVAITSVSDPVSSSNATDTAISGTGTAGASIALVVTDGTTSSTTYNATVGASGTWSIGGIDVSSLANGTITYDVTASDAAGNTQTASKTSTKDTTAPTVAISSVPDPINSANQGDVTVSGTGEAGATIAVSASDSGSGNVGPLSTTVAQDGTWSITGIDLTSLADGTITFTVIATDGVGNTTQVTQTATKDSVTTVAISSVTDPINAANETTTSIAGTGEIGAGISVVVSDGTNSTSPATATVAADGTWSITGIDVSGLDDATLTFTVTATDTSGNTNQASITAVKDTVAPEFAISSVTDPIDMSNESATEISGTGEIGATISVVVTDGTNSTSEATTTVDGQGNWSITGIDVSGLADGTLTFNVTAADAAGNETTASTTASKATLVINGVTDPITQANQSEVTINGTGQVGASVTVVATDSTDASVTPDAVTVDAEGNWSVTFDASSLADGTITFNVTATDGTNTKLGNTTATKDTVAEGQIAEVTSPINAINATGVFLDGTSELDATVSIVATDNVNSTASIDAPAEAGIWASPAIDVSGLADGTITFNVTITDALGNVNVYTITAVKDTVAPELGIASVTDPIGMGDETATEISGTGEIGATISVVVTDGTNSTSEATTTVDGQGNWSITGIDVSGLADGTLTFNVTAADAVGNETTASTTASKATLVINSVTDPITQANQSEVTINGTGQVGASITVVATDSTDASVTPDAVTVDTEGNWSVTFDALSLADGTITFNVTATDGTNTKLGNTTATKDTFADGSILSITSPINSDNETNVVVTGTAEIGATVSISVDDGATMLGPMSATVAGDGSWSLDGIDVSSLLDGTLTFTANVTDTNGNVTHYVNQTATKDTIAPTVDATTVDPNVIAAATAGAVTVSGTGEVGASVVVTASDGTDSTNSSAVIVDGDGNWSVTFDVSSLGDGTIDFTATATDEAGNTADDFISATKDTVTSVEVNLVSGKINSANVGNAIIYGKREESATVNVSVTDGVTTLNFAGGSGAGTGWSINGADLSSLVDGTITITATATDAAGNTATAQIIVQKDTTTSVAIASVTDPIDDSNASNTSISGTGEVDATISVTASDGVNSTIAFSITVDNAGNWSITGIDVSALSDGTITYLVTATDTFGNTDQQQITADKSTTAAPLTLLADNQDSEDGEDGVGEENDWFSFN